MSWIITIIAGIVLGWIAGMVSPKMRGYGIWMNIIHGIAGSVLGFWLFVTVLGLGDNTAQASVFSGMALIWEIIGAVVYLFVVNWLVTEEMIRMEGGGREAYGRGTAHEYEERERRRRK